jgi:hypothetical protein
MREEVVFKCFCFKHLTLPTEKDELSFAGAVAIGAVPRRD